MRSRVRLSGGWMVTADFPDWRGSWGSSGAATFTLDDVPVTREQACALVSRASAGGHAPVLFRARGARVTAQGITLTGKQALAITRGDDPLDTLLPGSLRVRALTLEELTAA